MLSTLPELLQQPVVQTLILCGAVYGGIRVDLKNLHKTQEQHYQEHTRASTATNKRLDGVIFSQLHRVHPRQPE